MKLSGQAWMTDRATVAVMAALEAAGGIDSARFVGGAVRNSLMGLAVEDVDIATRLKPQAVVEALAAAGLKSVPTGLAHGTVTAIASGRPFEITTLRRDVTTDGRNATVAFTDDWAEDAMRRDFRLNALYTSTDGTVFDPTGGGIQDALTGRVVFVGDAETRIREDYLRILRFFRFFAWYGKGEPDAEALSACESQKAGMARLSAERVQKELLKTLAAPDPRESMALMVRTGVLAEILPEGRRIALFDAMVAISTDPVLRLAALIEGAPRAAAERLRLSNAQRDRLIAASGQPIDGGMDEASARRILYDAGLQAFSDRLRLAQASGGAAPDALLAKFAGWTKPALPIGGKDALAAGLAAGPDITDALRKVEAWWIAADFPHDREAALAELRAVVAG